MRIPHLRQYRWSPVVAAVILVLTLFVPLAALQAGQTTGSGDRPRFRVDVYGGFSFLDPADLNRFVDYDRTVQEFSYDAYYDHLLNQGQLRSWDKTMSGEWRRITHAFPFGVRVRYAVGNLVDVSLGFQYMVRAADESLQFQYVRSELNGLNYIETLDLAPSALRIHAYWPSAGIHVRKRFGRAIALEGFAAAGPVIASCSYEKNWQYTWLMQGPGYTWEPYTAQGVLTESGSGTGLGFELGARLDMPLSRGLDAFFEGGYTYQVVKTVSGSGSEIQGEDMVAWEGTWGMKSETLATPWGTRSLRFPSSREEEGLEAGGFRLNLSGFRIKLGISIALGR